MRRRPGAPLLLTADEHVAWTRSRITSFWPLHVRALAAVLEASPRTRSAVLTVCDLCGSPDVQEIAWVRPNTGQETGDESPDARCWCPRCSPTAHDRDQVVGTAELYVTVAAWERITRAQPDPVRAAAAAALVYIESLPWADVPASACVLQLRAALGLCTGCSAANPTNETPAGDHALCERCETAATGRA